MITLEQYVGVHEKSPDWTGARKQNAIRLLAACAALETVLIGANVPFPVNPQTGNQISGKTLGGFRPQKCPQGAPHSAHKEGLAVDRYDPSGKIDKYLLEHQDLLEKYGIYMEHPLCTGGWSHWSIQSPGSGNHVFYP